jgi:hypothetical protein
VVYRDPLYRTPSTSSALEIPEDKEEDPYGLRLAEEGDSFHSLPYDRSISSSKVIIQMEYST